MDPLTIVGIMEGSISLAVQCGSVAKSLNNLAGQYKYAKLTISTMIQNLDIMQVAWERIGVWSKTFMPTDDDDFTQRLERFLETGYLVLGALEEDLQSYNVSRMTFRQRSRLVWNENILQGHQNRIRDQAQSMSLLLQAIQLPTLEATADLLQHSKKQFVKSDESAYSIVPSKLSSRISFSTSQTSRRSIIDDLKNMEYHPLSFDDDLFTARVYKRNYRTKLSHQIPKQNSPESSSAVTTSTDKHQTEEEIDEPQLKRLMNRPQTTTKKVNEGAEDDARQIEVGPNRILVVTTVEITTEGGSHDLDDSSTPASTSYKDLVLACRRGDNDLVKQQLATIPASTPENPQLPTLLGRNTSDSVHFCPITAAVFSNHVEVMRTLLQRAELENGLETVVEKVIGGNEIHRWRPLHVATLNRNLDMVLLLLRNGASVYSEIGHGILAVHLAARNSDLEILLALVEEGANLDWEDFDGLTPRKLCSASDNDGCMQMMILQLRHSVHPALTCQIDSPLDGSAVWPYISPPKRSLHTLDIAISLGLPSLVEDHIVEDGFDPSHCGVNGGTGLHTLLWRCRDISNRDEASDNRILRLLLELVELLSPTDSGETVLDSLLRIGFKYRSWLATILLENLPVYKILETRKAIILVAESELGAPEDSRGGLDTIPVSRIGIAL